MNDYEYTFRQEVKERKTLANAAKYRKNGSKSKKCTLPSDHLTRREKEALNGEVQTIRLNEPMTWEEFRSIPDDLQERYIACLVDGYHANQVAIAEMLGVPYSSFRRYISVKGFKTIDFKKFRGKHMKPKELAEWEAFRNMKDADILSEETETETEPEETVKPIKSEPEPEATGLNLMDILQSFTLRFESGASVDKIAALLKAQFGDILPGELTVTFRKEKD